MNSNTNQIYHSHANPQQAYTELIRENESFAAPIGVKKASNLKRKGIDSEPLKDPSLNIPAENDETALRNKLAQHFVLLRDIQENGRLRSELERTNFSLNLYETYKKEKKMKTRK